MKFTAPTVGAFILVSPGEDFDALVSGLAKLMVHRFGEPVRELRWRRASER